MSSRRGKVALQALGCAIAAGVVVHLVLQADAASTWHAARSAGPLVVTALVPFALGMALDAWGMVFLLRALGHRTTVTQMLPVRLASEALHATLPAGFVAADAATAVLLEKRGGVPLRDGVVASIARKWLVMRAHAVYIAAGALTGSVTLAAVARAMHVGALPGLVLASALMPLGLSAAVGAGLLGRSPFARLRGVLARLPSRRLHRWLEARRQDAAATDAQATRLRAARAATRAASLAYLACWCCEALESALLLHLVGARVELASVFAIEAGLSIVRSVIVLAPSGLGVLDLGYATVLHVLGVEPGSVAAFVLLRRAKEGVWAAAGYAILAALRRRPAPASPGVPELARESGDGRDGRVLIALGSEVGDAP